MADFFPAFERVIISEGGYKLTNTKNDRGGLTYAGISRKHHPNWPGWKFIDAGETPPANLVRGFYRVKFWEVVGGNAIVRQDIAESLFGFAVNTGPAVAIKLAQIVAGATPDGKCGPKTLAAINAMDAKYFHPTFALAKIARYRDIVTKDRSQGAFLLGWINRSLKDAV